MTTSPITTSHLQKEIDQCLAQNDEQGAVMILRDRHPADVTEVLDTLDGAVRVRLFRALPPDMAAQVLFEADSEFTLSLANSIPAPALAALLDRLAPDDAAAVLDELPEDLAEEVLPFLRHRTSASVGVLMGFPPDAVGHAMTDRFPAMPAVATVAETRAEIRRHPEFDTVADICVVDAERRLLGVVSLRALTIAHSEQRLEELITKPPVSVTPLVDREVAARIIARYNILALPVVDEKRILLGLFTVDDAMDVLVEEGTEDALRIAAVEPGEDGTSYWAGRIGTTVRRRFMWLLLLFAGATLTGTVLRHYEANLAAMVALSVYIPLLIGTGGNAGSQAVSTVIRGLAVREIRSHDMGRVFLREAASGFLLGLMLAVVGFVRALMWHHPLSLAITVSLTIVVVCTWANVIGALIPMVAARLRMDPAVMSAPLITTLVDATGLVFYFQIARALMHL